jgi:anti-sigma regulatory factor (Ser/Thr protein kinase)
MMDKRTIQNGGEYLSSSFARALEFVSVIEKTTGNQVFFDLSGMEDITPALALSLIVYCSKCGKTVQFLNAGDKLKSIYFDIQGLKPDIFRNSAFKAIMEGFADRSYTPIISFPSDVDSDYKDIVSTLVEDLIIRQSGIRSNVATGIKYIIEETLDNVTEHSRTDRGYIFAQANADKRYLDISIADRGVTLLGSYKTLSDNEIADDLEAIKAANRGISSKNLPEAENRGYGIYTSKRIIIEGLHGQYMMVSGSTFYLKDDQYDNFFSLPDGCRWEGTVVSFRLYYEAPDFSYIQYIE